MDALSPCPTDERDDEMARAFPGCILTHVLSIASDDHLAPAIAALQAARDSGAELQALHLTRGSDDLQQTLKVTGLTPAQARGLANRIAAVPQVQSVKVEHHLRRAGRS